MPDSYPELLFSPLRTFFCPTDFNYRAIFLLLSLYRIASADDEMVLVETQLAFTADFWKLII